MRLRRVLAYMAGRKSARRWLIQIGVDVLCVAVAVWAFTDTSTEDGLRWLYFGLAICFAFNTGYDVECALNAARRHVDERLQALKDDS